MSGDLASRVALWAELVENMARYDEDTEVSTALVWRDEIHDALRMGALLPPPAAELLERADTRLLEMSEVLVHRFPEVFEGRAPKEYWWWHLDGHPRTRQQTRTAAS